MAHTISDSLVAAKRDSLQEYADFVAGRRVHPRHPVEVFLEISNLCDLQCAMCHMFSAINTSRQAIVRSQKRGFMDTELLAGTLDEVLEHALVVHAFGYGEPTLHPQFAEVLRYLGRYGVMVDFFSHGNSLSQELCDLLVEQGVAEITISLSGSSQQDYESVYLGGHYDSVMQGLRRLKHTREKHGTDFPRVVINSIGFKHHVLSLPSFIEKMADVGVSRVELKPLTLTAAIRELDQHAADPADPQVRAALRKARTLARRTGVRLASAAFESTPLPQERNAEFTPITMFPVKAKDAEMRRAMREKSREVPHLAGVTLQEASYFALDQGATPCLEPFKTLYVAQGGNVYPCCFKNDRMHLGNANTTPLLDIWNGSMADLRQRMLAGEYPEQLCRQCVKNNLYPKDDAFRIIAMRYAEWFGARYARRFSLPLQAQAFVQKVARRLLHRGTNQHVLQRHARAALAGARDEVSGVSS